MFVRDSSKRNSRFLDSISRNSGGESNRRVSLKTEIYSDCRMMPEPHRKSKLASNHTIIGKFNNENENTKPVKIKNLIARKR
jgi:hypothetical protein